MDESMWSPVALIVLGSLLSLLASVVTDFVRRRQDTTTRWDDQRLVAFSDFMTGSKAVLMCADHQAAENKRGSTTLDVGEVYERVMLLGTSDVVSAADRVRRAVTDYRMSLPATTDGPVATQRSSGAAYAITAGGQRVQLSEESARLQGEAYAALATFVDVSRHQLRIPALDRGGLVPHPSASPG